MTKQTVWKWRKRYTIEDGSHTPHRPQTTLTPGQEAKPPMPVRVALANKMSRNRSS